MIMISNTHRHSPAADLQSADERANASKPKRKYSKNGCRECKRRKMKCDETKPYCWQCSRLDKPCVYDTVKESKSTKKRKKGSASPSSNNNSPAGSISGPSGESYGLAMPNSHRPLLASDSVTQHRIASGGVYASSLPQNIPPLPGSLQQPSSAGSGMKGSLSNILNSTDTNHNSYGFRDLLTYNHLPPVSSTRSPISNSRNGNLNSPGLNGTTIGSEEPVRSNSISLLINHDNSIGHRMHTSDGVPTKPVPHGSNPLSNNYFAHETATATHELSQGVGQTLQSYTENERSGVYVDKPDESKNSLFEVDFLTLANDIDHLVNYSTCSPGIGSEHSSLAHNDINNGAYHNSLQNNKLSGGTSNGSRSQSVSVVSQEQPNERTAPTKITSPLTSAAALKINYPNFFNYRINETVYNETLRSSSSDLPSSKYRQFAISCANTPQSKFYPHISLACIEIDKPHEKYLECFYNDFARVILPFEPYENVNPVRDVFISQASNHWYLLSAMLACGARSSYLMSNSEADLKVCDGYLTACYGSFLKSIEDEKTLNQDIEPVLLTVLLLTAYNAASKQQAWRTHLNGAKDLLKKYALYKSQDSVVLAFCIYWFGNFEMLVGLNNPYIGSLKTDEELDLLIRLDPEQVSGMKKLELIRDNGFNLLYGVHNDMVFCLKDLVKLLNRLKRKAKMSHSHSSSNDLDPLTSGTSISVFEIYELIAKFNEQKLYKVISADGKVPEMHSLHWSNYNYQNEIELRKLTSSIIKGVAMVYTATRQIRMYSWYDITHQSFTLSSLLVISTKLLNLTKDNPSVVELVDAILNLMYFLDYIKVEESDQTVDAPSITQSTVINKETCSGNALNYYLMLVQWQMFVAGLNCIQLEYQQKIANYFSLLAEIGVGSATYNLKKLRKSWRTGSFSQNNGGSHNLVGAKRRSSDSSNGEEADIVTY